MTEEEWVAQAEKAWEGEGVEEGGEGVKEEGESCEEGEVGWGCS